MAEIMRFVLLNDGYGNTFATLCQVVAEDHNVQINVTNDEINKRDIVTVTGDNVEACQKAREDVEEIYKIFKFKTEVCFSCGVWNQVVEFGYSDIEIEHDVVIVSLGRDFANEPDQDYIRIYGETPEACQTALKALSNIERHANYRAFRLNEHDIDKENCYSDRIKLRFNSYYFKPNFKLFEKKFKVRIELIENAECHQITIMGNSDKDVQTCKRKLQNVKTVQACKALLEQQDKNH